MTDPTCLVHRGVVDSNAVNLTCHSDIGGALEITYTASLKSTISALDILKNKNETFECLQIHWTFSLFIVTGESS